MNEKDPDLNNQPKTSSVEDSSIFIDESPKKSRNKKAMFAKIAVAAAIFGTGGYAVSQKITNPIAKNKDAIKKNTDAEVAYFNPSNPKKCFAATIILKSGVHLRETPGVVNSAGLGIYNDNVSYTVPEDSELTAVVPLVKKFSVDTWMAVLPKPENSSKSTVTPNAQQISSKADWFDYSQFLDENGKPNEKYMDVLPYSGINDLNTARGCNVEDNLAVRLTSGPDHNVGWSHAAPVGNMTTTLHSLGIYKDNSK